jgi:hypothetical protein
MKWSEKNEILRDVVTQLEHLQNTKGKEYSSDYDCLHNLKNGEEIGVSSLQKAWIFTDKHLSSIKSYIKRGQEISNEPIEGRILDAMNYLFLMYCVIHEEKTASLKNEVL